MRYAVPRRPSLDRPLFFFFFWPEGFVTSRKPHAVPHSSGDCFCSGGDIWVASVERRRSASFWSHIPARRIASLCTRRMARGLGVRFDANRRRRYLRPYALPSGELKRLTFDDGLDQARCVGRATGRLDLFSPMSRTMSAGRMISIESALKAERPCPVSADRFTKRVFQAAPGPPRTAQRSRFAARGKRDQQWWRARQQSSRSIRKSGFAKKSGAYERRRRTEWPQSLADVDA